jgi:hypothetical protein
MGNDSCCKTGYAAIFHISMLCDTEPVFSSLSAIKERPSLPLPKGEYPARRKSAAPEPEEKIRLKQAVSLVSGR